MVSKARNEKAFGRQAAACKQGLKWSAVGVSTLSAICLGWLPAIAAELSAWRYDSNSRSLTITLPDTVTPNVSVVAPDQLLVELSDTQLGDVHGQRVNDGFVEQIALEQATPETVWMVVEFVPGTVLSEDQQATPLTTSTAESLQVWNVQPALMMASRRTVEAAVATQPSLGADASDLAIDTPTVGTVIAQSDLPELPVLEPAVPLAQPVSVPPIEAAPVQVPEVAAPAVEIPVQSNETLPPVAAEAVEPNPSEAVTVPVLPAEPPFLGEIDTADLATMPEQRLEPIAVEPNLSPTAQPNAAVVDSRLDGGAEAGISDLEQPTEQDRSANASRWPEPIPFGQPLP